MLRTMRRAGTVLAGTTAAAIALAGPAAAHHCYKTSWQEAAHAQVASGTAWASMSDYVTVALDQWFGQPADCVARADDFVAAWMAQSGVEQEPIIHMKATAGGGAAHQGKNVPPFSYLSDADFALLVDIINASDECEGVPAE